MKSLLPERVENARITRGRYRSDSSYGANGAFEINGPCGAQLVIIASDGEGWEHVSVSIKHRCPNWTEMSFVKDLFWRPDETVIQYHPARSEYVNYHPYCLHLWKPPFYVALPPSLLVGPK